jgi:ABC-2 type transport system permease protein
MTCRLTDTLIAELIKLRGLPTILAAGIGTVMAAAVLATVVAGSAEEASAGQVIARTVPFLQIGSILIGILVVGTEYTAPQVRTTLTAIPNRPLLLAGKTIAYLIAGSVTSGAAVGAGLVAAWGTRSLRGDDLGQVGDGWPIAGVVVYLVLLGLLAFALALLLRSLVPPLVAMLTLVLIASPLLAGFTEHARWLPDQAGSLLYLPDTDTVLTTGTGVLVLLGWIIGMAGVASVVFLRKDA